MAERNRRGWRKGWDSNPRWICTHGGFQDRCLKPLGHPSALRIRCALVPKLGRFGKRQTEPWVGDGTSFRAENADVYPCPIVGLPRNDARLANSAARDSARRLIHLDALRCDRPPSVGPSLTPRSLWRGSMGLRALVTGGQLMVRYGVDGDVQPGMVQAGLVHMRGRASVVVASPVPCPVV
jgi:hypothetical protein